MMTMIMMMMNCTPGARITLLFGLPLCKHWPSLHHDHWSPIGGGYVLNMIIGSIITGRLHT